MVDAEAEKEKGTRMNENHIRVEAYLDQLLVPLARNLSDFHRDELRRELRAHLWGRVEAYRELGQSEADAVTEALRQFGGVEGFLKQWRREWMLTARATRRQEVWRATLAGLRLSVPILLIVCAPIIVWVSQASTYGHATPWLRLWLENHADFVGPVLAWTDFLLLPAALGIAIGRRTPRYAGFGAFTALAGEIAAGAILDGVGLKCWPHYPVASDILGQAALMEFAWLPIVCSFAALTGWGTQRLKTRKLA